MMKVNGVAGTITIDFDPGNLARKGAAIFTQLARTSVALSGRFTVALSGGKSPRPILRMLAEEPFFSTIPWDKTHVFWVDERCVPATDPASNYGAARLDLLDRVPIPKNQVHPMPVDLAPEEGAVAYQEGLLHFFQAEPSQVPPFDLICLGVGNDGHTASLFPGHSALEEQKRLVVSVSGGAPDVERLTLTLPLLNNAREIIFIASGPDKAAILKSVLKGPPGRFPAQMIRPVHGNLCWLVDREAASQLDLHRPDSKFKIIVA